MPGLVTIGTVASTVGNEGGVVLRPDYELNLEALAGLKVFVAPPLIEISYITISKALARGKRLIIFFNEIQNIDTAEKLAGKKIQVDKKALKKILKKVEPLPLGFNVYLDNNSKIGNVTDLVFSPAHRILIIRIKGGEILVPEVDQFVKHIDFDNKKVYLRTEEYLKNWARSE